MRVLISLLISAAFCYAERANPGEFPYYALSMDYSTNTCAGIILTEDLVLFSRKCIYEDDLIIIVGNVAKNTKEILPAKKYTDDRRAKDLVFLKVTEKIEFNSGVQPAKRIYESNGNEKAWKVVFQISKNSKEYSTVPAIESSSCRSMFNDDYKKYFYKDEILNETGACVVLTIRRDPTVNIDFNYLLTSEDGDVYGLPYLFAVKDSDYLFSGEEEVPAIFLVVNNYMDIINATIEEFESTK